MKSRLFACGPLGAALVTVALAPRAAALDSSAAYQRAQAELTVVEAEVAAAAQKQAQKLRRATPSERLLAADLLFRTRDYERAIDELNQLLELHRQGKADLNTYVEALFMLGESYFADDQLLAARRQYWAIVEQAPKSPYLSYTGRALARLVDVALRTQNLESLSVVFSKLGQLPSDPSGSVDYARGKAYFATRQLASARAAAERVMPGSKYYHQAQYLLGVINVKEAAEEAATDAANTKATSAGAGAGQASKEPVPLRFMKAVVQFQRVAGLPPDSAEHRHVIDLAWMALGRLLYEAGSYLEAADAYGRVSRGSPEFNDMLHELSWVYVRLGDYPRALRSLEVLAIASPETLGLADGTLLRGDLLLRSKEYERALEIYQKVRERYDPLRAQVDGFLAANQDPAVYYDRLIDAPIAVRQEGSLSQLVMQWAREEAADDRVFALISDVTRSRDLLVQSRRLAQKLSGVLASAARARAFPVIRAELEKTVGLLNRLGQARRLIAQGLEDEDDSSLKGELQAVRAERRALMGRISRLPVTSIDFARREVEGERQWTKVSQELQRVTLEADRLHAVVNGLKRVLQEQKKSGASADPASLERFKLEVEANERDLAAYSEKIDSYRQAVESGRVQIGFGDQRFVDDEKARNRFRELLAREVELCARGGVDDDLMEFAQTVLPWVRRADASEQRLLTNKRQMDSQVDQEAIALRRVVAEEASKLEIYSGQLSALDQHSREVVGEVAMRNFELVRDRLKGIVLRSDIGVVQQAWEMREDERRELMNLQRSRALEEQNLNDELREVLDDTEEAL